MSAQIIQFPSERVTPWDYAFDYDTEAEVIDLEAHR